MHKIHIHIEYCPDNLYRAIDDLTYDVDCDQDGYFSTSPTGTGKTPWEAARELIDAMEDERSEEE